MVLKSVLFGAAVVLASMPAFAQERRNYLTERVPAPADAFEIKVGTGYTQGFGMLQAGVAMPDVAAAGVGVDIGLAERATPHLSFGVTGQYQELNAVRGTGARGLTTGIDLTYHLRPTERVDPWLQIGPGYRFLWETSATTPTLVTHGFEIARVLVGADLRTGEDVALAPVIGGDLDLFLWQNQGSGTVKIADPRLSAFVFAGVQGRFDLGGGRVIGRGEPTLFGAR
jgi:hypothetical protein